jgi:hypothetical protein
MTFNRPSTTSSWQQSSHRWWSLYHSVYVCVSTQSHYWLWAISDWSAKRVKRSVLDSNICVACSVLDVCCWLTLPRCSSIRSLCHEWTIITPLLQIAQAEVSPTSSIQALPNGYKTLNHSSPAYISELIQQPASARSARNLRSSDTRCVLNPTSKKKFGDRGFSVAGPSAWNSLPASVRMASSINAFKSNLKTVLFNASYY